MRMRRYLPGCALLLLLAAVPASAQTPFALSNLGQKVDTEDARMVGRGGWGMAVTDSTNPGYKNVAGLSSVRHVIVSLVGTGQGVDSEDAAGGTRALNRVTAPAFRVAVPVIKGRLGVTAGFSINRSFRYDAMTDYTDYVRGDTLSGVHEFIRQGTLFDVPLGVGWEALPGLSLGATLSLVRGSLSESLYEIYTAPATSSGPFYKTVLQVQRDHFEGLAPNLSVLWTPVDRVKLGASWTPAYDIDVERTLTISGLTARSESDWTMTMPDEYIVGGQANVLGRWWLGADYQMQKFTEFEGPAEWRADGMEDESTFSVGVERSIGYERRAGLRNWPVRLGFSTRQWAYRVGGSAVTENTYSVGTGFPFRGRLGVLDVALSYSTIGDLADNGLEDSVWRMTLSVNGLERWW